MKNDLPHSFVVMVFGSWGRGKTLKEAAVKCAEAGGNKKDRAIVRLVYGDASPSVTSGGYLERTQDSQMFIIGNGFKLGQLMNLEEQ